MWCREQWGPAPPRRESGRPSADWFRGRRREGWFRLSRDPRRRERRWLRFRTGRPRRCLRRRASCRDAGPVPLRASRRTSGRGRRRWRLPCRSGRNPGSSSGLHPDCSCSRGRSGSSAPGSSWRRSWYPSSQYSAALPRSFRRRYPGWSLSAGRRP